MKGLFVQTYGCQMNVSDSERMKAVLQPLGYESLAIAEEADLVLINTCSIREKAEGKMQSFAHELKKIKKTRPGALIGITGCVAQQEKEKILEELPFVDLIIGTDNIDELPWIVEDLQNHPGKKIVSASFDSETAEISETQTQDSRTWHTETKILNPGPTAFVSVMKGCDHFCSYCIVPYTRGRERSRPIHDIVKDVVSLTKQGVKDITFLGQNINSYGKRTGESLHELFKRVHDIEALERIRFYTSHPGDLKDELIRCFEELPKLCSHFHLPVQSGSNRVLRAMRRYYTREQYLDRARSLRQARPDIALSTDIIVAFPGESEEDFEATLSLANEVRFDNAYSFVFSPRPGTSAAARPNLLTESEKMQRLNKLQFDLRRVSKELHMMEIGKTREVLIEGVSKKDATKWSGRSSQSIPVHIEKTNAHKVGDLVPVLITDATLTHLKGSPVVSPNDVRKLPNRDQRSSLRHISAMGSSG